MSFKKLRKEFKLTAIKIASEQIPTFANISENCPPHCDAIWKKNRPRSQQLRDEKSEPRDQLFRILVGNHIKDIIPSRSLSGNSNIQSTMSVVSNISLLGSYLWVSRNAEVKLVKWFT